MACELAYLGFGKSPMQLYTNVTSRRSGGERGSQRNIGAVQGCNIDGPISAFRTNSGTISAISAWQERGERWLRREDAP
jgi:hypothetical protein